jgi:hypothetical protein
MKSQKVINQQIKALTEMKPRVLRHSGFGDDHHAGIDAQIHVLKEKLTEDDIYNLKDECESTECADDNGIDWSVESIFDNGVEAARWLIDESELELLTDNWKGLVDKDPTKILRPTR